MYNTVVITATKIEIDNVNIQNFISVIVFLKDNLRKYTCKGRLIVEIKNIVIIVIKINFSIF